MNSKVLLFCMSIMAAYTIAMDPPEPKKPRVEGKETLVMDQGFSIKDYLTKPDLQNKMPQIETREGKKVLILQDMNINSLDGIELIPDINTVQNLDLSNNLLESVPPGLFVGLIKLEVLDLSKNLIKAVVSNAFVGLSGLQELLLGENIIDNLEQGAFAHLSSLRSLSLNDNKLRVLNKGALAGVNNLISLYLDNNKLETINPQALAHLQRLEVLDLSLNRLKALDPMLLAPLVALEELDLTENPLSQETKDRLRSALPEQIQLSF